MKSSAKLKVNFNEFILTMNLIFLCVHHFTSGDGLKWDLFKGPMSMQNGGH